MPTEAEHLERRLQALGLRGVQAVVVHENRSVMVSVTRHSVLRVHRGYAAAPDEVLRAIVRFVRPYGRRAVRAAARRALVSFPIVQAPRAPRARPERPEQGDERCIARLEQMHRHFNALHFDNRLARIPLRLSGRMRARLGEVVLADGTGQATAIVISRRHLRRDGWNRAAETLLHEMVHQWQAENGRPVNHSLEFRRKARGLGIEPRASVSTHQRGCHDVSGH